MGDGIWLARDRQLHVEYVLDLIVERKKVDKTTVLLPCNKMYYYDQQSIPKAIVVG